MVKCAPAAAKNLLYVAFSFHRNTGFKKNTHLHLYRNNPGITGKYFYVY